MRRDDTRRREQVEAHGGLSAGRLRLVLGVIAALVAGVVITYALDPDPASPQREEDAGGRLAGSTLPAPGAEARRVPGEDPEAIFVSKVLADTGNAWSAILRATDTPYAPPGLVTFNGALPQACGHQGVAMGSFYCPGEGKLYVDLDYLRELRQRAQDPGPATGDYAATYVIAHQVGHRVQDLLGTAQMVQKMLESAGEEETAAVAEEEAGTATLEAGTLELMVELQADCYAGIWVKNSHSARQLVEHSDTASALGTVFTIGDELLRQKARGYVMPDPLTHGTAEQRLRWFQTGLAAKDLESCETFASPEL